MKKNSLFHTLRVGLFIFMISLPFVARILGMQTQPTTENRKLNKKPVFSIASWQSFPKQYQDYFDDTFAFRIHLIKAHNYIHIIALRSSPRSDVIIGKNNWFFFNTEGSLQQEKLFTEKDLAMILNNLEDTTRMLRRQGIKFYLFITPNSQSIYPEYQPSYLQSKQQSRLDQLMTYIKENNSSVTIIDPRSAIIEGKARYLTYRKYDTHWNDYGAFLAYQELLNNISKDFPHVQANQLDDFSIRYKKTANTDLLGMLAMNGYYEEQAPSLSLKKSKESMRTIVSCKYKPNCEKIRTTVNNPALPRLLMYRDSFSNHLLPFVEEHFEDALYLWTYKMQSTDIKEQNPEIIIFQIVERNLAELKKQQLSLKQ